MNKYFPDEFGWIYKEREDKRSSPEDLIRDLKAGRPLTGAEQKQVRGYCVEEVRKNAEAVRNIAEKNI